MIVNICALFVFVYSYLNFFHLHQVIHFCCSSASLLLGKCLERSSWRSLEPSEKCSRREKGKEKNGDLGPQACSGLGRPTGHGPALARAPAHTQAGGACTAQGWAQAQAAVLAAFLPRTCTNIDTRPMVRGAVYAPDPYDQTDACDPSVDRDGCCIHQHDLCGLG